MQKHKLFSRCSINIDGFYVEYPMIQLVLVYCLMSDPMSCVEKRPVSEFPLTAMGCMVSAQPIAADFLKDHPEYTLNSFRCEINKPKEEKA